MKEGWLEAAKLLAEDPSAKVMCPDCAGEFLKVMDASHPDQMRVDRYLRCEICGAEEVISRLRVDS